MVREKTKNRIIKQLEAYPFEEDRKNILHCNLGYDHNSPGHNFCLSWLEAREAELRDAREEAFLLKAAQVRWAKWAAIIAMIAAIIANKENIFETINLFLN